MGQKIDKTLLYKIPLQGGIRFSLDLMIEIDKNIFMAFLKPIKKAMTSLGFEPGSAPKATSKKNV